MPLATFKDLCIDANDPATLGAFWGSALGLDLHLEDNGDAFLTGATSAQTVWINKVPEPKTVKNRMHLDVNVHAVDELVRAGATVVDADTFKWTLMADPEGGELCAFVREGEISTRLFEIVVDTADTEDAPMRIATWWADVLGAEVVDTGRGFAYIKDIPGAPFESIDFVPVPEPKTVKNRVHLDVTTPDLGALVAAGAVVLREQDDRIGWTVLADPDGNEFCAFTATA
jgi:hypothetical protein